VIGEANIAYPASASFFRPVSSEGRGLDGKRPHIVIVDELHEHPTPSSSTR
jgi:phage terminase large subunit-like protein